VPAVERALDAVDGAIEGAEFDVTQLFREGLLQPGIEVLPEPEASADEVLPEARLALVDTR
jgi:hypothetical protein